MRSRRLQARNRAETSRNESRHARRQIMLARVALMVLVLSSAPALAFDTTKLGQLGSITLDMDEIAAVIKQSPKLKGEIDAALKKIGKKPEHVICDGMRFPGTWKELGGLRVSPYRCQFGDKWLKINTKVRVIGKRGKVYERIDKAAMRGATDVKEITPTWAWSGKEPAQP
jgi:hypothetical protein